MRTNNKLVALGFIIWALAALCSCSIKEDRGDCPCYLEIDLSNLVAKEVTLRGQGQRMLFTEQFPARAFREFHEYLVPRGQIRLSAIGDTGHLALSGNSLCIQEGRQMDSLFARSTFVDTRSETAREVLRLNKQFATVSLAFRGTDDGRGGYDIVLTGNVAGVDCMTLEPVTGRFRCVAEADPEGGFRFRAPRQTDHSLEAAIYSNGGYVESIPLGELIARAGFDWGKEDLGDIRILADLPAHTFTITVMDWLGPVVMTVTI